MNLSMNSVRNIEKSKKWERTSANTKVGDKNGYESENSVRMEVKNDGK